MNYETELLQRLNANEKEIAKLKERAKELEMEQHKLGIALEVIKSLGPTAFIGKPIVAAVSAPARAESPAIPLESEKLSVRELVLREVATAGFALTKMDVVSRLATTGHVLNSTTVGSTLSKLVEAGNLEKAGRSAYRPKEKTIEVSN